jgi:hypothetical protein
VSISPTRAPLPLFTAYEPTEVAPSARMSHWHPLKGSGPMFAGTPYSAAHAPLPPLHCSCQAAPQHSPSERRRASSTRRQPQYPDTESSFCGRSNVDRSVSRVGKVQIDDAVDVVTLQEELGLSGAARRYTAGSSRAGCVRMRARLQPDRPPPQVADVCDVCGGRRIRMGPGEGHADLRCSCRTSGRSTRSRPRRWTLRPTR